MTNVTKTIKRVYLTTPGLQLRNITRLESRVRAMCSNPAISDHTVVSSGVIIKLLYNLETDYGLQEAVEAHALLSQGDDLELTEVRNAIGFNVIKSICDHWLGTMDYVLLYEVVLPILHELGYTTSVPAPLFNGSKLLSDYNLINDEGLLSIG